MGLGVFVGVAIGRTQKATTLLSRSIVVKKELEKAKAAVGKSPRQVTNAVEQLATTLTVVPWL